MALLDPAVQLKDRTVPVSGAFDAFAQKADGADLTIYTRSIYTGSGGNMKVTMVDGTTVTYIGLPPGTNKQMRIRRLWSTGTTVTDCIGEY